MPKEIKKQEKAIYIIDRYFIWIALALFLTILILGYFMVLRSKYSDYVQSRDVTLVAMKESLKNAENDKAVMLSAKKASLTPEEERLIYMAVPKTFDFSSIVSQLTALSQAYNFSVTSIDVAKGDEVIEIQSGQNAKSTRISLSVSGGKYEEFKRLLSAIEASSMVFDVLSVNFNSGQSYDLIIRSYYLN